MTVLQALPRPSDLFKLSEMLLTGTATATKYYLELTKQS